MNQVELTTSYPPPPSRLISACFSAMRIITHPLTVIAMAFAAGFTFGAVMGAIIGVIFFSLGWLRSITIYTFRSNVAFYATVMRMIHAIRHHPPKHSPPMIGMDPWQPKSPEIKPD